MRIKFNSALAFGLLAAVLVVGSADQAFAQRPKPEQPIYRPPAACTMEYLPVCGLKNGRTKTYPNACVAKSEGARVIAKGKCRHRGVSVRG